MKTSFLLGLSLAIGLLVSNGGTPAAGQNAAMYYQITHYAEIWSAQYPEPTAISGNGQKVAFSRRGMVYWASTDGSVAPQQIGAGDSVSISYDGSQVLSGQATVTDHKRLYLNGEEITVCRTHPQLEDTCLLATEWERSLALSGDGRYIFFVSRSQWGCEAKQRNEGVWYWDCAFPAGIDRLWRLPTAGGEPQLWKDNLNATVWVQNVQTNYAGTMAVWAGRALDTVEPLVFVGYGNNQQTHIFSDEYVPDSEFKIILSPDGEWVAYAISSRMCGGEGNEPVGIHIFRSDGSDRQLVNPLPYPASVSYIPMGFSEDGQRLLFEGENTCVVGAEYTRAFLVNRDGSGLTPVLSNATFDSRAGSLSYDGKSVAFLSASDILGNGNTFEQAFVLKAPGKPDLTVDEFNLDLAAIAYSNGRYYHPLDITVRNNGQAPAIDFPVQLRDNGGWSERRAIASLASGESVVLHLTWDITSLLNAGKGEAQVQLTVAADPDDIIAETTNQNNTARAAITVDARPRLNQVRTGYRPGVFLAGVALANTFDVWVDWNGALNGVGVAGESKQVGYTLNGAVFVQPVGNPIAAPAASRTYDMGAELQAGTNVLQVQAENAAGFLSDPHTLTVQRADNAAWLAAVAMNVTAAPPGAVYDKVAVYTSRFEWPVEAVEGYFDVPESEVNLLKREFGPKIDAWSLEVEFRSDGSGKITGSGSFEGEIKGAVALETTVSATGEVRATDQLRVTMLEGSLRGEGSFDTPRVPLSPWLSFLYAQAKLGAGADATLGVYEQDSGELEWSSLVLGLDATVEGLLSSGVEGIAYAEGGVGGQPRGEFTLPPDPDLLRSLTIRLYAWGKAQFLIWEKGYEAEYVYVVAGDTGQVYSAARVPQSNGWHVRARSANLTPHTAVGPQAMTYAYADPALSIAADDTLMLVWVDDEGGSLQMRASRHNGAAWSATAAVSADAFLNAYPASAYDSTGRIVALWGQLPQAAPPADPHAALPGMEIAAAVWDGAGWSAPMRLTDDAQLDLRPKLAADRSGQVIAVWVKDADGAYPLFPDEEEKTLGGDLYAAFWDGTTWSNPALAVNQVASSEAPQVARNGTAALVVWSQDADGSVGTITDTAIYVAQWTSPTWSAGLPLAGLDDGVADAFPRIAYDSAGRAHLVWVRGRVAPGADPDDAVDQLYYATFSGGAWSTPVVAVEATAIQSPYLLVDSQDNLVALWLARSEAGENLWYAVYDRIAGLWSDPIALTQDADVPTDYAAVLDSRDDLRVVVTGRQVITASLPAAAWGSGTTQTDFYPVLGAVRTAEYTHSLGYDLTLTELTAAPANPAPGTTALLTAIAHNSGDLAVTGAAVAFYAGDPDQGGALIGLAQMIPAPFRAGATAQVSVEWPTPAAPTAHTIFAVIDPANVIAEGDEGDNRKMLQTMLPDLAVEWAASSWDRTQVTVTASIRNQGVSPTTAPFTLSLRADDPANGDLLAQMQIDAPLAPGASQARAFWLPDLTAVRSEPLTAWVVADGEDAVHEADERNNTIFTALPIGPDVQVSPQDVGAGTPLPITVHNSGLVSATDVLVTVRAGGVAGPLLHTQSLVHLAAGGAATVVLPLAPGDYTLYVQLDPHNTIVEMDESNNLAARTVALPWQVYLPLARRAGR